MVCPDFFASFSLWLMTRALRLGSRKTSWSELAMVIAVDFPPPRNIRELQSAIGTAAVTLLGGDPASTASFDDHRLAASDVLAALRTS
jgi:hypothetical protein